jgi:hypothetical protein
MAAQNPPEPVPEAQQNPLLRRVDWRFLLRRSAPPRTLDLTSGATSEAVRLALGGAPEAPESVDLVVLEHPSAAALAAARTALGPGGEVACLWRRPSPGGVRRARERLLGAGFSDVRVYWPGPLPTRPPQFWLPLSSPAAIAYVLAQRPPRSRPQALLRPLWRTALAAGVLAPLWAVARAPDAQGGAGPADEIEALLPADAALLLLSGGRRSINKVIGLAFEEARPQPSLAVKFARVAEAESGLEREAEVLQLLETERPDLPGVPRLRVRGRRVGRRAVAEGAVHGRTLLDELTPETFGDLAAAVTGWLIGLAGSGGAEPAADWWPRLVGGPLDEFESSFGALLGEDERGRARRLLEGLDGLPSVYEHRDCSPWNVLVTGSGEPALLDWESAEPRGLPALDLVYFLANAAFVLDGALESGRTRESYARLLDPATPYGRVAEACLGEYSARIGVDRDALRRLRLLCWVIHCRSEYLHRQMDSAAAPDRSELQGGVFLGLVQEELAMAAAESGT